MLTPVGINYDIAFVSMAILGEQNAISTPHRMKCRRRGNSSPFHTSWWQMHEPSKIKRSFYNECFLVDDAQRRSWLRSKVFQEVTKKKPLCFWNRMSYWFLNHICVAVLLFIVKKRCHLEMKWYHLEPLSDVTLELSDITLELEISMERRFKILSNI